MRIELIYLESQSNAFTNYAISKLKDNFKGIVYIQILFLL